MNKASVPMMNKFVTHSRAFASVFVLCLLGLPVQTGVAATLTHRYSFDAGPGDSVGGADGILQGNAYITNGALVLDGTNSSVQLPNDLFTNYNSVSFELWYVVGALTSPNAQLYTFSGTNGAINYSLSGRGNYVMGHSLNYVTLPVPAVAGTVHLVWTQNSTPSVARLYVNGLLAGQNGAFTYTPAGIGSTTDDCIGGIGSYSSVSNFQGNILEFRTYQGALSPLDVAITDALGPDQAQLNPGMLEDVRIIAPPPIGPGAAFRLGVYADFANVTNVNISTQPDLVLSSDNTNVIAIAPDQRLKTVGLGMANITASYQGLSNTLALTVGMPQDMALVHRYGFNERTNDWIVHDSVGAADGRVVSAGTASDPSAAFTGNGELTITTTNNIVLAGICTNTAGGYVVLPPGILSSLDEVTIEAWVTWIQRSSWPWQRIFDFGYYFSDTYFFLTTEANTYITNGNVARATISTNSIPGETPRLDWTNTLPLNVTSFVAVTYSPIRGIAKLYINGQPVAAGAATIPLSAIKDANNWLGKSQFDEDSYFGGRYDEFRIYRGFLSDADVVADYAAGPNVVGVDYVLHDFLSSNSLAVTWGTTATNWFLESSPVLGPGTVWTAVTNAPTLENGRYRVTVPISADASFFRLRAP
jgi:hypothetical protein